eukprot:Rhum_TRINITY_DN15452_c6_g6::Rhum_TRINITY_DN15452_c6_g6_i13::g.157743::m.157743
MGTSLKPGASVGSIAVHRAAAVAVDRDAAQEGCSGRCLRAGGTRARFFVENMCGRGTVGRMSVTVGGHYASGANAAWVTAFVVQTWRAKRSNKLRVGWKELVWGLCGPRSYSYKLGVCVVSLHFACLLQDPLEKVVTIASGEERLSAPSTGASATGHVSSGGDGGPHHRC